MLKYIRVVIAITIYADVLISINLIIDYFLISLTSKLLKTACSFWRQLLGAAVGGVCSLCILIPKEGILISLALRVVTSLAVVMVTYGIGKFSFLLRRVACFYIVSFLFSGLMFALWYFLKPKGLLLQNGIVYYDLSTLFLVASAVFSYLLISLISRFINRKYSPLCRVRIITEKSRAEASVLVDSGNRLREPFSEKPVLLLDPKYYYLAEEYEGGKRVIPYKTVSGEGIIMGFRPRGVYLCDQGGGDSLDVYVAISPKPLGEYDGVIGSSAI